MNSFGGVFLKLNIDGSLSMGVEGSPKVYTTKTPLIPDSWNLVEIVDEEIRFNTEHGG